MTAAEVIAAIMSQAAEAEKRQKEEKEIQQQKLRDSLTMELGRLESLAADMGIKPAWLDAGTVTYQKTGKKHGGRMSTVVTWADGTKTVVICAEGDEFDPAVGLMLCYMKKIAGNSSATLRGILAPAEEYRKAAEEHKVSDAFTVKL